MRVVNGLYYKKNGINASLYITFAGNDLTLNGDGISVGMLRNAKLNHNELMRMPQHNKIVYNFANGNF